MKRLTLRILKITLVLLVLFGVPSIASADGITWTLDGVTFGDWTNVATDASGNVISTVIGTGGTASGSFVFDALAFPVPLYSNISVSTTTWATLSAPTSYATLTDFANSNSTGLGLQRGSSSDLTNVSFLFLVFNDPLTNLGGISPISTIPGDSMELLCLDFACDTFDSRQVTGGEVSGAAVVTPEPAAFSLLGIGLLALLIGSATRKVVSV
jgi:hypothetical protein